MSPSTIEQTGEGIASIAERFGAAVVGVGRGWRVGSGVLVAPGRILTAARHADTEGTTVTLGDGPPDHAVLAGSDRERGVAVLRAETGDAKPLVWAPADAELGIGTPVYGLANPGGRGLRVTAGHVSAAPRDIRGPRGRRMSGAVEHTAPLPRGSAGGPLLDLEGRIVGINLIRTEGGLVLALGASGLRDVVARLARGEEIDRPTLGVAVAPAWVARKMRRAVGLSEREGLLVRGVEEGSPAGRAGIERGDLIVAAAGTEVDGIDALHRSLESAAGRSLTLTLVRGDDERDVDIDLAAKAA
jgi:S1-C subfamily serine protease